MVNDPARPDLPSGPGSAAPQRRSHTGAVVVSFAAVVLALAAAAYWWRPWVTGRPLVEHFPAGGLDEYLPENSAAVLDLNMKQLGASPVVRQHIKAPLDHLTQRAEANHHWASLVGLDPFKDIDWLRVVFIGGDTAAPLWIAKGRFDPARFQVGPGKLQPKVVDRFHVFERADASGATATLAHAGDFLVAGDSQAHVLDALNHAADGKKAEPADALLREQLQAVDRKQSIWLAVSLTKLGRVPTLHSNAAETVLRPVLNQAQAAHGGFTFGNDLEAQFAMKARDEAAAGLEQALKGRIDVARDLAGTWKVANALGLFSGESDLLPVIRLVGAGEVTREGATVRLRCRLPADQLGP